MPLPDFAERDDAQEQVCRRDRLQPAEHFRARTLPRQLGDDVGIEQEPHNLTLRGRRCGRSKSRSTFGAESRKALKSSAGSRSAKSR
jgi:hypothetical protein